MTIVCIPQQVLTQPAKKVLAFDKKLEQLIKEMKTALIQTKNPKGVGLAAPQIGEPWRVFITRPTEKSAIRVFINPEVIEHSEELTDGVPQRDNKLEGCLSIPKIWGKVKRFNNLTLRFQNETGQTQQEKFEGFLSTIIQHETDHLNGILFTHRALEQKGKLYEQVKDKEGKDVLEEISL